MNRNNLSISEHEELERWADFVVRRIEIRVPEIIEEALDKRAEKIGAIDPAVHEADHKLINDYRTLLVAAAKEADARAKRNQRFEEAIQKWQDSMVQSALWGATVGTGLLVLYAILWWLKDSAVPFLKGKGVL